jgi:hypothetical protein
MRRAVTGQQIAGAHYTVKQGYAGSRQQDNVCPLGPTEHTDRSSINERDQREQQKQRREHRPVDQQIADIEHDPGPRIDGKRPGPRRQVIGIGTQPTQRFRPGL